MADFVARSQQQIKTDPDSVYYGVGYYPEHSFGTSRFRITRTPITKMAGSELLGECTFTITFLSNFTQDPPEQRNSGYNYAIDYEVWIGGARRGTARLVSRTQYIERHTTYTRTLKATNIPLGTTTSLPAFIRTVNDRPSSTALVFDSRNQGGDTLTGIPLGIQTANFTSFSNFTVTDASMTISASVTARSSGVTHTARLKHGGTTVITWTGLGNFTSLAVTQTQARALLNRLSSVTSASITLEVQTIHGGSVIHTQTRSATATVGVTPSIGSVTVSDSSGALTTIGALVQGVSNITLSINNASAGYGATNISYGHNWAEISEWTSSATKVAGTITRSGDIPYTGRVRNSRGQVVSLATTETVLPWSAPRSTSVQVQRCTSNGTLDPAGSYIRVTGSHSVSPLTVGGVNKNTLRVLVRYRIANTSAWTNALNKTYPAGTVSTSESHTLGGGALDPTKTYEFEVIAYDRYASTSVTGLIPTERVLISRVRNETVGFGKIGERGIIDARGDVYIDGDLYVEGGVDLPSSLTPSTSQNFVRGQDLNHFTTPGFYHTHVNTVATTLLNAPTASAFSMIVTRNAGVTQHVVQYPAATPRMWVRNQYNANWGEWKLIPYTSERNGFPVLEVGSTYFRTPTAGLLPYSADSSSGQGGIGSRYQPFREISAVEMATNSLKVLAPNGSEIIMLAADQPTSTTGKVWVAFGDSERVSGINVRTSPGSFFAPTLDDNVCLGLYSQRWKAVYAVNGTIVTSGREHKEDIVPATDAIDELLDVASRSVVTFKYKETEGMLGEHVGLVADDLKDLEGFKYVGTAEKKKDGTVDYGLKPMAIASLALHGYHKQKEKLNDLEKRITRLEEAIEKHCSEIT